MRLLHVKATSELELPKAERRRLWIGRFGWTFCLAMLIRLLLDPLWRLLGERRTSNLLDDFAWSLFFSLLWSWRGRSAVNRVFGGYNLQVTADQITAEYYLVRKTIHRGCVRTISERRSTLFNGYNRPGLTASDAGRFKTWFFGAVFIPEDLAEYPELKQLIQSWRAPL